MAQGQVSLTIEGAPGAEITVEYRSHDDPLPPPLYVGKIGDGGSVTISVPRAYLIVHGPGFETAILHLESGPASQSVQLKPA